MIEQQIEKMVMTKLWHVLKKNGISNIQVLGSWQPDDDIKGEQDESAIGFISIKTLPRSYDTPTIADAQIQCQVNLLVRSDIDYNGKSYLEVTDLVNKVLHKWQKSYDDYYDDFTIEGEFEATGFQLDGGDCGIDKQNCAWNFLQQFTIYGIIQNY